MNRRRWVYVFLFSVMGSMPVLAADYRVEIPFLRLAKQLEARKDYEGAVLVYNKLLEANPKNQEALKHMISCHEKMVHEELKESTSVSAPTAKNDGLPDLPEIVPDAHHEATPPTKPS